MKNRFLLIPALLLGATALGGAAIALGNNKVAMKARAETPASAITDSQYDAAIFESYGETSDQWKTDKPLGTDYHLARYLYSNGNQSNWTHAIPGSVNQTSKWRFSDIRYYNASAKKYLVPFIKAGSSSDITKSNIFNTTIYNSADYPDEYAIGQLLVNSDHATFSVYGGSMISSSTIENITDISFYWRYSEAARFHILYQLNGTGDWALLTTCCISEISYKIEGNYSGTMGGLAVNGFKTANLEGWTSSPLYNQNAKLAFVVAGNSAGDMQISGFVINANKSTVKYLDKLAGLDNICDGSSAQDLHKTYADYSHNQDLFQFVTGDAVGSELENYTLTGTKTTETHVLNFYNHLVSKVPGLGSIKAASSKLIFENSGSSNVIAIVCIATSVVAIAAGGLLIGLKKKKHQ